MSSSMPPLNQPAADRPAGRGRPPVRVHGHVMLLHDFARDKWISPYLAAGKLFEPFETEWMQNLVRPGDTVLDVGAAYRVLYAAAGRLVGPAGRVLAFEPDPANFALLQQNVVLNRYANVSLYHFALAQQAGSAALFLSGDNAGDHRLWRPAEARTSVHVPTVALDDFLDPAQARMHFIKMDIQGAECSALAGMTNLLRRQTQVTLVTEFWPMGLALPARVPRSISSASPTCSFGCTWLTNAIAGWCVWLPNSSCRLSTPAKMCSAISSVSKRQP